MTETSHSHCSRPWWKRPPVWVLGIVAVLLVGYSAIGPNGRPPVTPYGAFLDQLDAGNVASVVFRGMEIDGRFKQPLNAAAVEGSAPTTAFRSRVPDFGDPALIAELRQQRVTIEASSSSPWMSWFGSQTPAILVVLGAIVFAKPGLFVLGALFIAGLVKAIRGGKKDAQQSAPLSNPISMHPMHGAVKLMSGLFEKPSTAEPSHDRKDGCPMARQPDLASPQPASDPSHGRS